MPGSKKPEDQYDDKEAQQRFEAALRGARIAGHKPKESVTPKRKKAQPAKKK